MPTSPKPISAKSQLAGTRVSSVRLVLSSALAQPGLEILTASDPEQGIDLVFERHPQIVLTDLDSNPVAADDWASAA